MNGLNEWPLSIFRDYMTVDRYARERGLTPVPAIDVDASVTSLEDVGKLRSKFRDILRCFDHPKFIHLGPKMTSILLASPASEAASIYDYIPVPLEETTFILCANNLHGKDLDLLPENVILAHYGFQVNQTLIDCTSLNFRAKTAVHRKSLMIDFHFSILQN